MKNRLIIYYTIVYVLVAFFALNLNYIEGDDASTIIYHALGRDVNIQPYYSTYHSMFDTFLRWIKTENEYYLRIISIGTSFVFSYISLLALGSLLFIKSKKISNALLFVLYLLPFIIPEILFSSLLINPTNISFTFLLISHILFIKYANAKGFKFLIFSIILFGFGVSFRWINAFYLFVIFGDFILREDSKVKDLISFARIKKSLIISPFFIISVILFIQLSGFSILDIYKTYSSGGAYIEDKEMSYLALGSTALSFFTPSFIILLILGFVYCLKQQNYRSIVWLMIAIIPYFIIGFFPSYKYMINIIPILVILLIKGASISNNKYFKISLIFLIFIVWILGVKIDSNSAWGPGFEMNRTDNVKIKNDNFNPDKSIKIKKITLIIGSGMAMPTLEGPRPLFGYSYVFFNKWYSFVKSHNEERNEVVLLARENNYKILQDVKHSFIYSKLLEFDYKTGDSVDKIVENIYEREFRNEKDSIIINVFLSKNDLLNRPKMNNYLSKNKNVIIYSSYSNIISKIKINYQEKFDQKGNFWGILSE